MLESGIRTLAIAACALVAAGFVLFALDDLSDARNQQVNAIVAGSASQERARDRHHSAPRRFIDDADDVLLSPFASVTAASSDSWAVRGVPTLLALLIYGLGVAYLANWMEQRD